MTPRQIAEVCHEANRALTRFVQDVPVQPHWDEAPEEMQVSSVRGVAFALEHPDAGPEAQHLAWCDDKLRDGWKFGPVKDAVLKTHPALRPYAELSEGTRAKDKLFRAIVGALR